MKSSIAVIVFGFCVAVCVGQRSPYAGGRPVSATDSVNRGQVGQQTTQGQQTQTQGGVQAPAAQQTNQNTNQQAQPAPQIPAGGLPYQVGGDFNYYNQLQSLPQDQQPFWLLNHQHIVANRNQPSFQLSPFAPQSHHAG